MAHDGTPNLDCLTDEQLHAFAHETRGVQPRTMAARMFGRPIPKGAVGVVRSLNCYAWNAITARACRLRGDIQTALMYEGICERIYNELPTFARW